MSRDILDLLARANPMPEEESIPDELWSRELLRRTVHERDTDVETISPRKDPSTRSWTRRPALALVTGGAIVLAIVGLPFLFNSQDEVSTTLPLSELGSLVSTPAEGRVVFSLAEPEGPTQALVYIDNEGIHQIPVGHDGSLGGAVWGPGDEVLFHSTRNDPNQPSHLFAVALEDGRITQLTNGATGEGFPAVSPDGTLMVFERWDGVTGEGLGLFVAATDGSGMYQLTPAPRAIGGFFGATFSPDGQQIAYIEVADWEADSAGAIFVIPVGGGEPRQLTEYLPSAQLPRWSPDGLTILFSGGLLTVPVEGGEPTELLEHPGQTWEAWGDWSPSGDEVVFAFFESGGVEELRIASVDGSNERTMWVAPNESVWPYHPFWGS